MKNSKVLKGLLSLSIIANAALTLLLWDQREDFDAEVERRLVSTNNQAVVQSRVSLKEDPERSLQAFSQKTKTSIQGQGRGGKHSSPVHSVENSASSNFKGQKRRSSNIDKIIRSFKLDNEPEGMKIEIDPDNPSSVGGGMLFEEDKDVQKLTALLAPHLHDKESVLRALLNVYADPSQEERHDLVLEVFEKVTAFVGSAGLDAILSDYIHDSKLNPLKRMEYLELIEDPKMSEKSSLDLLRAFLEHSDAEVREEALRQLSGMSYQGKEQEFEGFARDESESADVRVYALYGLNLRVKRQLDFVLSLTHDANESLRYGAINRLHGLKSKAVLRRFEELIQEENDDRYMTVQLQSYLESHGDYETLRLIQSLCDSLPHEEPRRYRFKSIKSNLEKRLAAVKNSNSN